MVTVRYGFHNEVSRKYGVSSLFIKLFYLLKIYIFRNVEHHYLIYSKIYLVGYHFIHMLIQETVNLL